MRGKPLTARDREVLAALVKLPNKAWARPMDVGAFAGSHHSATLAKLVKKRFAIRQARSTSTNALTHPGSWEYRATHDGVMEIEGKVAT